MVSTNTFFKISPDIGKLIILSWSTQNKLSWPPSQIYHFLFFFFKILPDLNKLINFSVKTRKASKLSQMQEKEYFLRWFIVFFLVDRFYTQTFQDWESETDRQIYTLVCFIIQYLIPSLSVCLLYTKMMSSSKQISFHVSKKIRKRKLSRRKKTNRMLIMVSFVFFLSWAPLNILNLTYDLFSSFQVM